MNAPTKSQSLIVSMAQRVGMDPVQFAKTVRATAMPSKHTDEQFAAFLMTANQYRLNPILREIYAFPTRAGGIAPVVSIDGWVNLVNSHPDANGFSFEFADDDKGNPVSVTCTMWRRSRDKPVVVTEYYKENYRNTEPWNLMPRRMLRHKAFKEAARYCFGLAGITDEDEARDMGDTVAVIEHEIPPADLDAFAAADVLEQEDPAALRPDAAAGEEGGGGSPSSLTATPTAAADLREDLVKEALLIATDDSLDEDDRIAALDGRTVVWEERVPDVEFCRQVLTTAVKVVRKQLPEQKARLYLSTLIK
jgi:phage recombination protein Bet